LSIIDGCRGVCRNEVHAASVRGWYAIHKSPPNVKVLAVSALGIRVAVVAESGAGADVVFVDESKPHVPRRIVCPVSGTKDKLITVGCVGVCECIRSPPTTLLDIRQSCGQGFRLLATQVGFLRSGVDVGVEGAFEIRPFTEHVVKEIVIEFVVKVGEHTSSNTVTGSEACLDVVGRVGYHRIS